MIVLKWLYGASMGAAIVPVLSHLQPPSTWHAQCPQQVAKPCLYLGYESLPTPYQEHWLVVIVARLPPKIAGGNHLGAGEGMVLQTMRNLHGQQAARLCLGME